MPRFLVPRACGADAGAATAVVDATAATATADVVEKNDVTSGPSTLACGSCTVWRDSALFTSLREPQSAGACASCGSFDACRGGCMAAKFFTGLPLDGPDPECVLGHGEAALAALDTRPHGALGHSKVARDGTPVPVPVPAPVRFRTGASASAGS